MRPSAAPSPQQFPFNIRLPITTPPAQTPKIVSTGIAESAYTHSPTYSETGLRDRYLWIEFDSPIADAEDDTYFGRILGYLPDPLLATSLYPAHSEKQMLVGPTDPPIPI